MSESEYEGKREKEQYTETITSGENADTTLPEDAPLTGGDNDADSNPNAAQPLEDDGA